MSFNLLNIVKNKSVIVTKFKAKFWIFCGFLLISSCGHWGWEDVTSDYESELNVVAILSSTENSPSMVMVEKTLGLSGPQFVKMEIPDTVWSWENGDTSYWIDRFYYRYLYEVDNAEVIISDGVTDYHFVPDIPDSLTYDFHDFRKGGNLYLEKTGTFNPQPETTYYFTVETPDGLSCSGEVTTPAQIEINNDLPDTLIAGIPFTVSWTGFDGPGELWVSTRNYYFCGSHYKHDFQEGEHSWTSPVEVCDDYWNEEIESDTLIIEIMAMNPEFYDYFVKYNQQDEFINFILGAGDTPQAYGIEGGLGVFGAISVDRIQRIMKP